MKGQWGKLIGYVLGTAIVTTALTLLPPLFGGGAGWLPALISREGGDIDKLFWGMIVLSIVIMALVGGVVIYSLVHFRAAPGDMSDGEHIHGNAKMEVVWIVVPSLIVLVLGVFSYAVLQQNEVGLFDKAAAKDDGAATMQVDVRGFSFGWAFRYLDMDGKPLTNEDVPEPNPELVLPIGEVVKFNVMSCSGKEALGRVQEQTMRALAAGDEPHPFETIEPGLCEEQWNTTTAEDQKVVVKDTTEFYRVKQKRQNGTELNEEEQAIWDAQPALHGDRQYIDVNHAFWVPEARLKVDAVAGLRTYVQWEATEITGPEDEYQVVCAELCGTGHNGMRTDMCVVDKATFDWWAGLDEAGRKLSSCVNLRLMTCLGSDVGDRDEALEKTAVLSKGNPEASCEDVEEKVA
jgi:cytochrome c oxidase subunit 2